VDGHVVADAAYGVARTAREQGEDRSGASRDAHGTTPAMPSHATPTAGVARAGARARSRFGHSQAIAATPKLAPANTKATVDTVPICWDVRRSSWNSGGHRPSGQP